MELLALLLKDLIGIFLAPAHALQLSQVLASWKRFLQFGMLVFVCFELSSNALQSEAPLFLKQIILLEASAHMSFILLVVFGDLRFTLLEDFNFETTLARPLLSQVLIELFNRLILQVFNLSLHFVPIVDFLCQQPAHRLEQTVFNDL